MNPYYFVILYFVLLSSRGSFLFYSDIFWLPLFLFILVKRRRILLKKENSHFFFFALGFVTLSILQFVFNSGSSENFVSNLFFLAKYFFLTFLVVAFLNNFFIKYLLKVMYFLSIVSLFFYAIQLANFDFVYSIGSYISSYYPKANPDILTKNFIVFTISNHHKFRNAGFTWEPGAFGCFLVLTLYFSLHQSNFKFRRQEIVFVIALITTLSTTAFLAFFILIFVVLRMRRVKLIYLITFLIPLFYLATNVSIISNKIEIQIDNDVDMMNNLAERSTFYESESSRIPLNRFASMMFLYSQFGYKLILGMGNKYEIFFNKQFPVNLSNGVFDYLARFGLIGLIYYLIKTWRFFLRLYNKECAVYLLFGLLLMGFGEPILLMPFFSCTMFFRNSFFANKLIKDL